MKKPTLIHLILAAGLCLQTASAADKYWDRNGAEEGAGASPAGTWDAAAANWSTDAAGTLNANWVDGDFAIFSAGADAAGAYNVTLAEPRTASGLTIEEGSVILAGSALTVGANKVTVKPGAKLSISGSSALVGATGALIELDGGTMENRATGNAGSFVSSLFNINVTAAGGTLSFPTVNILNIVQATPVISGPGGITKVGAGVLAIVSTSTYGGTTTINEGELRIRTSADRLPVTTPVVVNSPGILNLNGLSQKIGSLSGNGDVGTGNGTLTIDGSASTTFTGALKNIANAGAGGVATGNGRLIKAGSGTITFNGLNDIRGSVTLNNGGITVGPSGSLCGGIADVAVNGGTLTLNNAAQQVENLTGTGGTIVLSAGHVLTVAAVSSRTNASVITGAGTLVKTNIGATATTLSLMGANDYSGGTIVVAGTLDAQTPGSLGTGDVSVTNGATLKLQSATAMGAGNALILQSPAASVDLAFTGTVVIEALSLDGGATFAASGTWGAVGSGADREVPGFTGTGIMHVMFGGETTTTTLSSSTTIATYGNQVTLTATVTGGTGIPTGAVAFMDEDQLLGTVNVDNAGTAILATTLIQAGTRNVTARYKGDFTHNSSTSPAIAHTVGTATVDPSVTIATKPYDATTDASIQTRSLSGLVNGDIVTLGLSGTAVFADKNVGTWNVNVTGLALAGAAAANYVLSSDSLTTTGTIEPKALTVDGLSVDTRAYDATTAAVISGTATPAGVVGTEDISVTGTPAGAFLTPGAETGKSVPVTGLSLAGADIANYTLVQPTLTGTITPLALTVTGITAENKPFDGGTNATIIVTNAVLVGVIAPDDVSLITTNATGAFRDPDVGEDKPVDIYALFIDGASATNYSLLQPTVTADIKIALTLADMVPSDKVYDGTAAATVDLTAATLVGVVSPDEVTLVTTESSAAFADKHAGAAKVVTVSGLTLAGANAEKYLLSTITTNASITAKALTVTATGVDKVYDGTIDASVTFADDRLAGDEITMAGDAAFADKTAGLDKPISVIDIALSGADAANYAANATTTASADISARPLAVTATGVNKVYDGTTAATVTLADDRIAGDVFTVTATAAFADENVGLAKPVSVVDIAIAGADAANYAANTTANTTANIAARALVVTATAANKAYDGTTAATATLSDDRLPGDVLTVSYTAADFADKNAGTAKTVNVAGIALAGDDAPNYTANTTATATADITKAPLTVTAENATRVYGAADPAFTATITGFIDPDTISVVSGAAALSTTATATSAPGNYPITPAVGTLAADNYAFTTFTDGTLTITIGNSAGTLVSSLNPAEPGSNVTFTATISAQAPAAGTPTGEVIFLANDVPFSTNALTAGTAEVSTTTLPLGTNVIVAAYTGDANFVGVTNSLEQVIKALVTYSTTNSIVAMTGNPDGTFTLTFQGTPQAQYYVVAGSDIAAATSTWSILAGSTNTVTNASGLWSFTVTNDAALRFYRSAAINPAP